MEYYQREFFINRIRSGFIKLDNIYVKAPAIDIEYEASELYINELEKALSNNLLTDEQILQLLYERGEWSPEKEKEYSETLPKHIEYWKKQIYYSYFKSATKKTVKKYLKTAQDAIESMGEIRHSLDSISAHGQALYAKNLFLFSNSTFDKNGNKINWEDYDIIKYMNLYHYSILSPTTIRELARTSPWTIYWHLSKKSHTKIFPQDNLNIEQQQLIQWASMYDNIEECPDCPTEDIIEDDDALDGWLLIQREKRQNGRNASMAEATTNNSKFDKASELFIMVETPEDAAKVNRLNNPIAQNIVKNRFKQIQEQGTVKEQALNDIKQQVMMDLAKMGK